MYILAQCFWLLFNTCLFHICALFLFYEIQMILRLDLNSKWKCDSYRKYSYRRRNNVACDNCIGLCWLPNTHPSFLPKRTPFLPGISTVLVLSAPDPIFHLILISVRVTPLVNNKRTIVIQASNNVNRTICMLLKPILLFEAESVLTPFCHIAWINSVYIHYRVFHSAFLVLFQLFLNIGT